MKKILFVWLIISLSSCVVQNLIESPLTISERNFYHKIYDSGLKIDSLKKTIYKYAPLSEYRGLHSYTLELYFTDSVNSLDSTVFRLKVDSIAKFIANYMKQEEMGLHDIFIYYSFIYTSSIFEYEIDKNNNLLLKESTQN